MAHSDVIDSLIATYRNLNLRIRPLDSAATASNNSSLLDTIASLRESEIRASQTIKLMTLGEAAAGAAIPEAPPSANASNVRTLLSEFGTAREAILATVREMSEEDLAAERPGFEGASSIRQVLDQLVERDQKLMQSL
ncbi:MAG TPA: hypothetical protein PKA95_10945 [Thermomicrobiales bacterium]|nr:hypothetical protein [Thermomicrobiales bacterium]